MENETPEVGVPAHLRPVLQAAAKNLLHHLYGSEGPAWGTRFADLEQAVKQLSDFLGTELLQQALQRQAHQPVPEPLRHCPSCGRPTQARDPEPRSVQTDRGTAAWQEPASHCDRCRKAFFPSVQESGH
jgi:NADH pyrophosphatase NudC (nudix superfamily)